MYQEGVASSRSWDRECDRDRRRDNRAREQHDQRRSLEGSENQGSIETSSADHSPDNRRQNRKEHRDHYHQRRSRSHSRSRSRSRERDDFYRSRDRSWDHNGEYGDNYYDSHRSRRQEPPNHTIMLKGLGFHTEEKEIASKVAEAGLKPKDIRLMRKKTGEHRGFAFVEFNSVDEAVHWKNKTQGYIMFSDGHQASLHFSIQKDSIPYDRNAPIKCDWTCFKCGVVNFKRRENCFKCSSTREEASLLDSSDLISSIPTSCILLRNLNAETSEQRVLSALGMVTSFPIKSLKIPRENGTSKGICMVELYTVGEATQLNGVLTSLPNGFTVDGHNIDVCFARRIPNVTSSSSTPNPNANSAASVALAAAQWSNQTESNAMQFVAVSHPKPSPAPLLPASISTQILIPLNAPVLAADYGSVTVTGISYRKYPIPDVSTYQYEATSGYYYDPVTCLYYDANTHYYYNGTTLKYLFWSHEHQTYLPIEIISLAQNGNAVTNGPTTATASEPAKEDDTKEKADKVKIAKKIAKDMEKWAKTLNQKKETLKTSVQASLSEEPTIQLSGFNPISFGESIALKDTRLKALEKSALFDPLDDQEDEDQLPDKLSLKRTASPPSPCSVEPQQLSQVLNLTDWNKLLCLLCKRQFNSREQLMKHQQASELHKTNLFKLTGVDFTPEQIAELSQNDGEFNFSYRDRAKERRAKYGMPEVPDIVKQKDKLSRSGSRSNAKNVALSSSSSATKKDVYGVDAAFEASSGASLENSIGAKMLKQMGWNDGQGLGKKNQGRSRIIEVERRAAGAGLGAKVSKPVSGESYKDAVKRTMMERYKQLHEQELNSKM